MNQERPIFDTTEFKLEGKMAFKRNYWNCVIVSFIISFISGILSFKVDPSKQSGSEEMNPDAMMAYAIAFLIMMIISEVIATFVTNPLTVGRAGFFKKNLDDVGCKNIIKFFKQSYIDYVNIIINMFITDIIVMLFYLLLIVPGIIKSFEYALVPYILSDNPEMSGEEARKLSSQAMDGNKMNLFLFKLSFIGWVLLTIVTFGLAGIFYVNPYMMSAEAAACRRLLSIYEQDDPSAYISYDYPETENRY